MPRIWGTATWLSSMMTSASRGKYSINTGGGSPGRRPGEPPPTLIEYLPKDALVIIDESHVAVPQIRGMYYGDRSRKETLVEYGFRLPSAFDNRPLNFEEFTARVGQTVYVSATPDAYELELSGAALAEQVIRPTGLMDPHITVRPARDQVDDLLHEIRARGRLLEAQRLEQRTLFDVEMLREIGYCHGIENYSRHLSGRRPGQNPATLMDYLPKDTLVVIDESHVTVPQIRGMYAGDRSRKETLVEYGFRLPSAFDNRPLTFEEFAAHVGQVLYVSATPGPYELRAAGASREDPGGPLGGAVAEQIIRPTGLMDPRITVRPAGSQVDDLMAEVRARAERNERVLITTLTKRMAEDLTEYYQQNGLRVRYLHSDIDTLERVALIRDLRLGKFDGLIGINLLREGLDIPEVSLVAILDADKEGYLRSATSLIQTAGRAARNVNGEVLMYADTVTGSMRLALGETERRRAVQGEYNRTHGITPESIRKSIRELLETVPERDYYTVEIPQAEEAAAPDPAAVAAQIAELEKEMREAARRLDFERAAELRDRVRSLRRVDLGVRA